MQISRSGFYYWSTKPVSNRSKQNNMILLNIIHFFKRSHCNYGSPRIYKDLKADNIQCSLNKVARMMHDNGIYSKLSIKHKKVKIPRNNVGFAANILDRQFDADQPNQKWVSDTTFIYTRQGWLYLATVLDLFSRKIVGWSMSKHNDTALVISALKMAIKNKPKEQEVLLHSDQGATYRAYAYLALFKKNNIKQSMSEKGKCHDNAVAESFFNTLKRELVNEQTYKDIDEAKSSIFEYIEVFYNKIRRHSYLNYESPNNFEKAFYNAQQGG
jgi:transposase InsO family protein